MLYRIETRRWIEGYEYEIHHIEANSKEEAKELLSDGQFVIDAWVDVKNSDGTDPVILEIEEG